jgi:hypothetical protein
METIGSGVPEWAVRCDWLVQEGLKDINDESGRWSIPSVLGARL